MNNPSPRDAIICGLKITHDGGLAVIDHGSLAMSFEVEKHDNNRRHAALENLAYVPHMLHESGYSLDDIDLFVIDGWGGASLGAVRVRREGKDQFLPVAPYCELGNEDVFTLFESDGLELAGASYSYQSFSHAGGHIASAWYTSPFASAEEDTFVLCWDGGMLPRLYYVECESRSVRNLGPLLKLYGNVYSIFAQHFEPFLRSDETISDDSSISGKLMAYVALGEPRDEIVDVLSDIYGTLRESSMETSVAFSQEARRRLLSCGHGDSDILASFHDFLQREMLASLQSACDKWSGATKRNMCYVGGCALNIKWNSAIRDSGVVDRLWIPPMANDSGSAFGAACAPLMHAGDFQPIVWDVYSGNGLVGMSPGDGWQARSVAPFELGVLLHETNEPVVFLHGRAEMGPRALGNRSILAAATSPGMKDLLNRVKLREDYRPVAPVCLEDRAGEIFVPGTPDPYMLYEHRVAPEWRNRVPAIIHLDETARLQTVNAQQNSVAAAVLRGYESVSGIPVLCNTSANFPGCGFFPDAASVAEWGKLNYLWCDGTLYERERKIRLLE